MAFLNNIILYLNLTVVTGTNILHNCTHIFSAHPRSVSESHVVVNPAYQLQEDVLALQAAAGINDEDGDEHLEIGYFCKRLVIQMMTVRCLRVGYFLRPK